MTTNSSGREPTGHRRLEYTFDDQGQLVGNPRPRYRYQYQATEPVADQRLSFTDEEDHDELPLHHNDQPHHDEELHPDDEVHEEGGNVPGLERLDSNNNDDVTTGIPEPGDASADDLDHGDAAQQPSAMESELELEPDLPAHRVCDICRELMSNPVFVLSGCNHPVHATCLSTHFKSGFGRHFCPKCRNPATAADVAECHEMARHSFHNNLLMKEDGTVPMTMPTDISTDVEIPPNKYTVSTFYLDQKSIKRATERPVRFVPM